MNGYYLKKRKKEAVVLKAWKNQRTKTEMSICIEKFTYELDLVIFVLITIKTFLQK